MFYQRYALIRSFFLLFAQTTLPYKMFVLYYSNLSQTYRNDHLTNLQTPGKINTH